MNRALLRPSYDRLIIHAVEQASKYKCEKGEESGGAFWAVSHYSDGCDQMSCVTSWCRAYHNTSGHCFISAARLRRPESRLHCADGKCGLSVIPLRRAFDCHHEPIVSVRKKEKKKCVYLGRPWLHPPCCRAQCRSRRRGRCCGPDSEELSERGRVGGEMRV